MPHLKVTQKGIVSPQHDIDLEVPHVAATLMTLPLAGRQALDNLIVHAFPNYLNDLIPML